MNKKIPKLSIGTIILLLIITLLSFSNNNYNNKSYALDDEILTLHFLDVGQGDSIFIELPNDETLLIDAGEKNYGEFVYEYITDLSYDAIDYVVGTHPHTDHIGGLETIINNFEIGSIYMPKASSNTKTFLSLLQTIEDKNLTINTAKKGVNIIEEDNLLVTVLSPSENEYDDLNNYSVVLKIVYYDNSFLFMGDAEKIIEEKILDDVDVDVIKIGHHGSNTSSSKNFVDNVSAQYGIIQVGLDNKYEHPHNQVIKRWENSGTIIYRTDIDGNIIVKSDGSNIIVEKEK